MAKRLVKERVKFIIPPTLRFENNPGEQYTMLFIDPFGNPIEFKSFLDINEVFNT
jgi:extradiol dioxygenase family protein